VRVKMKEGSIKEMEKDGRRRQGRVGERGK